MKISNIYKLCTPSLIYLVILFFVLLISIYNKTFSIYSFIISILWLFGVVWFLNYLCSKGYSGISWFLSMLPIILFIGTIIYTLLIVYKIIPITNITNDV